jgi:mRNA interferase YafQ
MMLTIKYTSRMTHDVKLMKKQKKDLTLLAHVLDLLAAEMPLPPEYRDHQLSGKLHDFRECHIENDWLLVYQIKKKECILSAVATGSHSNALTKYLNK